MAKFVRCAREGIKRRERTSKPRRRRREWCWTSLVCLLKLTKLSSAHTACRTLITTTFVLRNLAVNCAMVDCEGVVIIKDNPRITSSATSETYTSMSLAFSITQENHTQKLTHHIYSLPCHRIEILAHGRSATVYSLGMSLSFSMCTLRCITTYCSP
jgi:hypothetical protein